MPNDAELNFSALISLHFYLRPQAPRYICAHLARSTFIKANLPVTKDINMNQSFRSASTSPFLWGGRSKRLIPEDELPAPPQHWQSTKRLDLPIVIPSDIPAQPYTVDP